MIGVELRVKTKMCSLSQQEFQHGLDVKMPRRPGNSVFNFYLSIPIYRLGMTHGDRPTDYEHTGFGA